MWKVILVCLFFQLKSSSGLGQNNSSIQTEIGFTRFDFFHSFQYTKTEGNWNFSGGLGYGIIRSLFQQRFYPRTTLSIGYNLLQKERIQFEPIVNHSYSFLNYNKLSNEFHHWNEYLFGIRFAFGKKWKVGQTVLVGYYSENFKSASLNQRVKVGGLAYYGALFLKYEI